MVPQRHALGDAGVLHGVEPLAVVTSLPSDVLDCPSDPNSRRAVRVLPHRDYLPHCGLPDIGDLSALTMCSSHSGTPSTVKSASLPQTSHRLSRGASAVLAVDPTGTTCSDTVPPPATRGLGGGQVLARH